VANAILDGTDCVMLSGESAVGRYPVEAVAMLARIAQATERIRAARTPEEMFAGIDLRDRVPAAKLVDLAVDAVLEYTSRAVVFVPTRSGGTARSIARGRLPVWIVAVSSQESACGSLQFSSGVYPVFEPETPRDWSPYVRRWLREHQCEANLVVLTQGPGPADPAAHHRMEIIDLSRS
jgi:pyruvate kinase